MPGSGREPLFDATLGVETRYIGVPIHKGIIGLQIAWPGAVISATVTLELTSFPVTDAAVDAAASYFWKDSGETITGPAASAAGSSMVHLENVRQLRARLKVVTTAGGRLIVHNGGAAS